LKDPPAPPSLQETVPVGDVGEADESVTVAVSVREPLVCGLIVAGFGATAVDVG
jgi:hypothetical protein